MATPPRPAPAPPAGSLTPNGSEARIDDRAENLRRGCGEYAAFQQKVWEILEDPRLDRREQRQLIQAEEMKLRGRVCCRGCRSVENEEILSEAAD